MMNFLKRFRHQLVLAVLLVVFLALRIPALSQPYHQDEYKWALIVAPHSELAGTIPHPPLSEAIYIAADRVFGNAHLRMLPFVFSIINFFLIFAIAKKRFGVKTAYVAAGLFAVSYFSVLASLMVDTDGQVLPAFFLLALLGYDRWKDANDPRKKWAWFAVFVGGLLLGLLTKLSCVLPVGAFFLDWLIDQRHRITKKMLAIAGASAVGAGVLLVGAMLVTHQLFPQFDLATKVQYWMHFLNFMHRNWFQVGVQVAKGALYASPLLIAPLFLVTRRQIAQTRVLWLFLGCAAVFYLVLFDFSVGALDRYLQLVVVPFSLIASTVYVSLFEGSGTWMKNWRAAIPLTTAAVVAALAWLPNVVPPLHPKSAWLSRMVHFKWNFLFPFDGGSGPLGFYISFAMIGVAFVVAAGCVVIARWKSEWSRWAMATIVCVGLAYNAMFAEEYLFGLINGNATAVTREVVNYVATHSEIEKVTTFNDIGAYELMGIGKYYKRLYVDPAFDVKTKLNSNKGWYMMVNIPRIDDTSVYADYFRSCKTVFTTTSRQISGTVMDCHDAITIP